MVANYHRSAKNVNQKIASDYAKRQLSVLSTAMSGLAATIASALSFSTLSAVPNEPGTTFNDMHNYVELLSLDWAFDWLRVNYVDIYNAVVELISEDQDEPLPLNWAVLVEDWDHTYWVVWIFIVWLLWARDGESFRLHHDSLSSWLLDMNW